MIEVRARLWYHGVNVSHKQHEQSTRQTRSAGGTNKERERVDGEDSEAVQQARLHTAVNLTLNSLSDTELATFHLDITWNDGDMKTHCESRSYFSKVQHLFTESEGKNLHPATADAVAQAANHRLPKSQ